MAPTTPQPSPPNEWYVYIVRCSDDSYYTGITTNLTRRIADHNRSATGAKYTRSRRPVYLVYSESATSRSDASKREAEIKKMKLPTKLALINRKQ